MRRDAYDVRVSGLSLDQARSLAAALSTAAIAVKIDRARGTLVVPGSRNRMFDVAQIACVIDEWVDADDRRTPSVTLLRGAGTRNAMARTIRDRAPTLNWQARTSR